MHERSVAADLVRAAGVTAVEEGGTVRALHISIGSLSCIDPVALRDQVVWYSRGTVTEGAAVHVEVLPADLDDAHAADVRLTAIELAS
jgi:Zn finger protein HypA/HybF involved in hydrogenase expression